VRKVGALDSEEALGSAMRTPPELGFSYFALPIMWTAALAAARIRLTNYPPRLGNLFRCERLGPSDPVHRASHLTSVGFAWSQSLPE
jgi:LuxR family quorum-sensing system transcriptional regulator CciR